MTHITSSSLFSLSIFPTHWVRADRVILTYHEPNRGSSSVHNVKGQQDMSGLISIISVTANYVCITAVIVFDLDIARKRIQFRF